MLHGFETAHANRSRVLNKIQSLRESEPWPGYDTMTVVEIPAAELLGNGHAPDR
jgi:hypothetical protein